MNILLKSGRVIEHVSDEDVSILCENFKYGINWQTFTDENGKVILTVNISQIECIYDNSKYSIDKSFTTNINAN